MSIEYRDALVEDLPGIVAMLADDPLGAMREDPSLPLAPGYVAAFHAIAAAPHQRLVVAAGPGGIVGTMQLIFISGLSARGSWHGQIEAVRIAAGHRKQGHGEAFVGWAIKQFRVAGCTSVQLTSDSSRADAHRFWKRVGFRQTHAGFKLGL